MPTHGNPGCLIIAACGLKLITDPAGVKIPTEYMPGMVQCRVCRNVWVDDLVAAALKAEARVVRQTV